MDIQQSISTVILKFYNAFCILSFQHIFWMMNHNFILLQRWVWRASSSFISTTTLYGIYFYNSLFNLKILQSQGESFWWRFPKDKKFLDWDDLEIASQGITICSRSSSKCYTSVSPFVKRSAGVVLPGIQYNWTSQCYQASAITNPARFSWR